MPFDIDPSEDVYQANEDRSWLGSRKGMNSCRTVTLDVSTFLAAHIADGAIPSGTILSKLASGKYGPYLPADTAATTDDDVTEVSTLVSGRTGATFDLIVNGHVIRALDAIAANVTAATVQARIRALGAPFKSVTVTGTAGDLTITWVGVQLGDLDVRIVDNGTGGTAVVLTEGTAGAEGDRGTADGILFNTTPVGRAGSETNLATAADVGVPMYWEGIVLRSFLPAFTDTNAGELDAAAEADLRHIRFEG